MLTMKQAVSRFLPGKGIAATPVSDRFTRWPHDEAMEAHAKGDLETYIVAWFTGKTPAEDPRDLST
jgi:hypothetical protein